MKVENNHISFSQYGLYTHVAAALYQFGSESDMLDCYASSPKFISLYNDIKIQHEIKSYLKWKNLQYFSIVMIDKVESD